MLHNKELASPKQMALGKDFSNPLIAGRLLKTTLPTRFVELVIDHQLGDISHHKDIYDNPSLTKKVFANMKRVGTGFSGIVTALFGNTLVPATQEVAPKVPSPAPSLEHKLPSLSNDPLPGGEDSLKLKELMDLCTHLSNKVLELESEVIDLKSTYKERIEKLEGRVDKLEDENRVLKDLHSVHSKVDTSAPVVEKEKSFKQGRIIADIDEDDVDEEPADIEEVLEVVKAAKLMIKVVTTARATTTAEAIKAVKIYPEWDSTSEPEQQLAYKDLELIKKLDMEEMDLKWKMAMLYLRVHKFEQKARRKIDFDKKESARFNKQKVKCYKCKQRGHFARECKAKGGNDKQRYSSFKVKEIRKKEEDSKALITVDTLVDWLNHDSKSDEVIAAKEFGMIASCDSVDAIKAGANKLYNMINGANLEEANTPGDAGEFALMGVTSEHKPTYSSCASTSSVSTYVNEAKIDSNVRTPIKEPISVQDLPGFTCNSSEKNEHSSRTSCNKNASFNKKTGHFRKYSSSVSKLCFVCGSGTHLIKDCDFYEKQMTNMTVSIGVGHAVRPQPVPTGTPKVKPVPTRKLKATPVPTGRPKGTPIPTGELKATPVPTGRPIGTPVPNGKPKVHPVTAGKPKFTLVPTGRLHRPFLVATDKGCSPSVPSGWWSPTATHLPHFINPTSLYFQPYTPYVPTMYYNHMQYGRDRWATVVKPSSGCSWKAYRKGFHWVPKNNGGSSTSTWPKLLDPQDEGIFDSRCSRSMTGNKDLLDDFQAIHGGKVTFVGREGRITRKRTIRKQHKVSYKTIKAVSSISEPLQLLHMDLFGPTSIRSIDHKYYCLVITDDYNRFCWVFFLEHKDETYPIFKNFINLIENQLNKKVKAIRCDNGTEFKNAHMIEHYGSKWIKREYSNPRTLQQNRVGERKKETLIEASRTLLTDSKLPTMFWTEAIRNACYVLNRVFVTSPHNKTPYALLTRNIPTVEETMNLQFLEDKPNVQGLGHEWYFDGTQDADSDSDYDEQVISVPSYLSNSVQESQPIDTLGDKVDDSPFPTPAGVKAVLPGCIPVPTGRVPVLASVQVPTGSITVSTGRIPVPAGDTTVPTDDVPVHSSNSTDSMFNGEPTTRFPYPSDLGNHNPSPGIFCSSSYDDEFDTALNNVASSVEVSLVPTKRIHTIHPQSLIFGYPTSVVQTRSIVKENTTGKYAIGTKWILKNKRDARGIVFRNKARLVAQGHRQEEDIDYDEVFALVAQIEAIRLFLAFASYMGFLVYQMDVKSAFLYGRIEKEVQQRSDGTFIHQDKYVQEILHKFDLGNVTTATTPYEAPKPKSKSEYDSLVNVHLYKSMIVKKIFKYLKGQPKLGLWYPKDSPLVIEAYSDSDYAGANKDRKSITGGCQFLGRRLISWQCKKQTIMATSSTVAEYVAAANCYGQPNDS
nr:putative ribonuclease H-like domain-containing protein [Tanacetum cinerariifolium]